MFRGGIKLICELFPDSSSGFDSIPMDAWADQPTGSTSGSVARGTLSAMTKTYQVEIVTAFLSNESAMSGSQK